MKVPTKRYAQDREGMPVFAAEEKFVVLISEENMRNAIPEDDQFCAIALGCKRQLGPPYVSVGRSRTDLAMPHPEGVVKPGFGNTTWAVIRYINSKQAREVVIAADTKNLEEKGVMLTLLPPSGMKTPEGQAKKNGTRKNWPSRKAGHKTESPRDELTLMGVRSLTGQRRRT